jgi:hypothetical protein
MPEDDKRFKIGWASVALMIGISLIINYFSKGDILLVFAVFFIGLAMILCALNVGIGKKNDYLMGISGILGFMGIICILIHPFPISIDFGLFIGGILVGCAIAYIGYLYIKK